MGDINTPEDHNFDGLKSNDKLLNARAFRQLRKHYYGLIESLVVKNSGNKDDVPQLFNDSALALYWQVRKDDFKLTAKPNTYFYSIARHKWLDELRKRNNKKEISLIDDYEWIPVKDNIAKRLELDEGQKILQSLIEQLRDKCKSLIDLFYNQDLSMTQIAKELGIVNRDAAKNQKKRCLEKLRTLINKNPGYQRYLKDYLNGLT